VRHDEGGLLMTLHRGVSKELLEESVRSELGGLLQVPKELLISSLECAGAAVGALTARVEGAS
jgi:hypothetical protein